MAPIARGRFMQMVAHLDGQAVHTIARGKAFRFALSSTGLTFAPASSGKERRVPWSRVDQVLKQFNETGSFTPGRYHDITFDSSYILSVLQLAMKGRS